MLEFLREKCVTVDVCPKDLLKGFVVKKPRIITNSTTGEVKYDGANPQALEDYIKNFAISDQLAGRNNTYVVYDKWVHCIIGYFSLKAGSVRLYDYMFGTEYTDLLPGVELAMFAVNENYAVATNNRIKRYYGMGAGEYIFLQYALPIIQDISSKVGMCILYLFALPDDTLINYYQTKLGFNLPQKEDGKKIKPYVPTFDDGCTFMYRLLRPQSIK